MSRTYPTSASREHILCFFRKERRTVRGLRMLGLRLTGACLTSRCVGHLAVLVKTTKTRLWTLVQQESAMLYVQLCKEQLNIKAHSVHAFLPIRRTQRRQWFTGLRSPSKSRLRYCTRCRRDRISF